MFDILIRGGKVIDPSQGLSGYRDVAVKGGKIAALLDPGAGGAAGVTVDATGHLVARRASSTCTCMSIRTFRSGLTRTSL